MPGTQKGSSVVSHQPLISLCMIARDNATVLDRCLQSSEGWVDQIVIVDMGSSDATREVAAAHGATVIERPWDGDLAAARNLALTAATGDWVLSLEPDETLSREAGSELRELSRRPNRMGAFIPLRMEDSNGETLVASELRAWRHQPLIRWRYRIDEQVLPAVLEAAESERGRVGDLTGQILRRSTLQAGPRWHATSAEAEQQHRLQVDATPEDPHAHYRYALFLRAAKGRADDAEERMARAYEALRLQDQPGGAPCIAAHEICAHHSLDLQHAGESERALEVSTHGVRTHPRSARIWYAHGCALSLNDRWGEAEAAFEECLEHDGVATGTPSRPLPFQLAARKGRIRAADHQGRHSEAADSAWNLLQEHPQEEEVVYLFLDTAASEADWSKTARRLIDRVNAWPLCATSWLKGGELFFRLGMFDKALPWILRSAELVPDPTVAHGLAGECFLASGHFEPAVDSFSRGMPQDRRCRAGLLLVSLAYGVDLSVSVEPDDDETVEELKRMVMDLHRFGHDNIKRRLTDARERLRDTDPAAFRDFGAAFIESAGGGGIRIESARSTERPHLRTVPAPRS